MLQRQVMMTRSRDTTASLAASEPVATARAGTITECDIEVSAPRRQQIRAVDKPHGKLAGKRFLVIKDEPLVAMPMG